MKRWKEYLERYGTVAIVVYFTLFGLVLAGTYLAWRFGFRPEGVGSNLAGLGAAYAFTKITQPLRLLATLGLTPLVARVVGRRARPVVEDPPA